jgi:hypothetical protein
MNIFATGRVRNYQLGLSAAYVAELIAVYVLFRMGYPLVVGVSMKAVLNFVVVFVRLYYTHTTQPQFSLVGYSRQVLLPVFCAAILTIAVSLPVANMTNNDLIRLSLTPIIVIVSIALAYFVGLNKREKKSLRNLIYKCKRHA